MSQSRTNDVYAWPGQRAVTARTYVPNALNQYSTVAGATQTVATTPSPTVTTTTLRYDPLGRLYEVNGSATGITRFLYDGDDLVAEYNSAGTMLRRYVHGDGADQPEVWFEGAGVADAARRYLYADERGSVIAVTDGSGNETALNSYDEYGIPDDPGQLATKGRFRYTGQMWIPELGMSYYKARMYSPTLGRFMQTDPIGYGDGMNMYGYVHGDPVNGVDPTGLATGGGIVVNGQIQTLACSGISFPVGGLVCVNGQWVRADNPCQTIDYLSATTNCNNAFQAPPGKGFSPGDLGSDKIKQAEEKRAQGEENACKTDPVFTMMFSDPRFGAIMNQAMVGADRHENTFVYGETLAGIFTEAFVGPHESTEFSGISHGDEGGVNVPTSSFGGVFVREVAVHTHSHAEPGLSYYDTPYPSDYQTADDLSLPIVAFDINRKKYYCYNPNR